MLGSLVANFVAEVVKTFENRGIETLDEFRYETQCRDSMASH